MGNSPLNCGNDDERLETVAAGIVARLGFGNHNCQSDPATQPEGHGNELHGGDHDFMGEARKPDGGEAQVRHGDNESPAAIEEHVIDGIRERPIIVQGCNDYADVVSRSLSRVNCVVGTNRMQSSQ